MHRPPEFGPSRESRYLGGLTPAKLAEGAGGIWQKRKSEGNPVSKPVALGLAMRNEGREIVRSLLSSDSSIASDVNSAIKGLSEEGFRKFRYGFGEIILWSIIDSLEKGVFEWDDGVFVSNFNEAIIGTPLPQIKLEDIKAVLKHQQDRGGQRLRTADEQTKIIRRLLSDGRDKDFLNFLESSSSQVSFLPQTIYTFIYGSQSLAGRSLSEALPVYKQALINFQPIKFSSSQK